MANLILGIGTSHSPHLSSPVARWSGFAERDRRNTELLGKDGEFHTYEEVLAVADSGLAAEVDEAVWAAKNERAQRCLATLTDELAAADPDVVIVVGDDQSELFGAEGIPAIGMFLGEELWEQAAGGHGHGGSPGADPSAAVAARVVHPVDAALGRHLAERLTEDGFDLTVMTAQPDDRPIGHAFTFGWHHLGMKQSTPIVPILLNTYFPPNVLSASRCLALGRSLRAAVESWDSGARVAVVASGGLSHFVIMEELDRKLLDDIVRHDYAAVGALPREILRSGNSEILNWITVAAMFEDCTMELLDYIPTYRTPAGTGPSLTFARWGADAANAERSA